MLAMVYNGHQNDWDVYLPHVEYAYNNSVSAATGLAPNVVHMGRLPRLPLAIFDRSHGGMYQNLDRDQLAYCDLARERQQRTYELVREQHALTVARVNGCNSALSDALLRRPQYAAGGWVWVYNTAATIRQGMRKDIDNKVLKEKLSLNWTGPFKIIAIGPSTATDTPDGRPLGDKLLYLDLPSNLSGPAAQPRDCSALQTLCQPVRCRLHTSTSPCRPYAIRLTRLCDQVALLPRHHGRRLHPPDFNRCRQNHRSPMSSRSRRCNRCLIRDTLEWHPPPHMRTGIGSPSLPTPHSCLLGEWSGPPPTQYPAISTAAY